MNLLLQIHPEDNVGVAPRPIAAGARDGTLTFPRDIPMGHKAALRDPRRARTRSCSPPAGERRSVFPCPR